MLGVAGVPYRTVASTSAFLDRKRVNKLLGVTVPNVRTRSSSNTSNTCRPGLVTLGSLVATQARCAGGFSNIYPLFPNVKNQAKKRRQKAALKSEPMEVLLLKAQVLYEFLQRPNPFAKKDSMQFPWEFRASQSPSGRRRSGTSASDKYYCETKPDLKEVRDLMLEVIREKIRSIVSPTRFIQNARDRTQVLKRVPKKVSAEAEAVLRTIGTDSIEINVGLSI